MCAEFVEKGCGLSANDLIDKACDPRSSCVIEACAGSGKTWLLISRIFRLLLDGVAPNEILAITFTRKAAQEMRERLESVLKEFAQSDDEKIIKDLKARGLSNDEARLNVRAARGLFEQVLSHPQPVVIDTFHGWFSRLCQAAPIGSGVSVGSVMREDGQRLIAETMANWWAQLGQGKGKFAVLQEHYLALLKTRSVHAVNNLLMGKSSILYQVAAWSEFVDRSEQLGGDPLARIAGGLSLVTQENPIFRALNTQVLQWQDLELAASWIGQSDGPHDIQLAKDLKSVLDIANNFDHSEQLCDLLRKAFFTQSNTPKVHCQRSSTKLQQILKNAHRPDLIEWIPAIFQEWTAVIVAWLEWQKAHQSLRLNQAWLPLAQSMSEHFILAKQQLRVQDFSDLEWHAHRLMSKDETAAYLQARLDAKYKHILIDEFQDTNPLQWQILKSWLGAYSVGDLKPSIFLVGDPKQSIYRFRRADARLFAEVQKYLEKEFAATHIRHNETRRNPPGVMNQINKVFLNVREILPSYPFFEHQTVWQNQQGGVDGGLAFCLPLTMKIAVPEILANRQALTTPMYDLTQTSTGLQSYQEALQVGRLIQHWLKHEQVIDRNAQGSFLRRPVPSDFLILMRSKTHIRQIERAFLDLQLPCQSPRKGGLLKTLEAADIQALLNFLLMPSNQLALAHVLRSPIFQCTELDLEYLARDQTGQTWWQKLQDAPSKCLQNAAKLLQDWLALAGRLPVHDLLDRIYAQGRVMEVYAATAPPLMRAKVLANLEAFLHLALDIHGGRYPSLSRMIDELARLNQGDDEESPDEGESNALELEGVEDEIFDEQDQGVIRIMSIHAAKGLEAPFVFLMHANSVNRKQDPIGVMVDWPPASPAPNLVCAYDQSIAQGSIASALEEEKKIAELEKWNVLYVAMTRAKQYFVASGSALSISPKNLTGMNDQSWYAHLIASGMPTKALDDLLLSKTSGLPIIDSSLNDMTESNSVTELNSVNYPHIEKLPESFGLAAMTKSHDDRDLELPSDFEDVSELTTLDQEFARALGVAIHLILERYAPTVREQDHDSVVLPSESSLGQWLGIGPDYAPVARESAQAIFNSPHLQGFFRGPDLLDAWDEVDLFNQSGERFRVDRIAELTDRLIILDYKLRIPSPSEPSFLKYRAQLINYRQLLGGLRVDKPIQSFLVDRFGDVQEITE